MIMVLQSTAFAILMVAGLAVSAQSARAADIAHPTVVELFQSQGCSSCPPANANVMAIADDPTVLTLSWQVTYWDNLGWKDTFDNPAFTKRQYEYADAFHRQQVFTPEVVVNGRSDIVGSRRDELDALVHQDDRGTGGPSVTVAGDRVTVSGPGSAPGTIVLLVRYNPNILQVPIRRGENGGQTLPHRNVVRQLVSLGDWKGQTQTYALPAAGEPGLKAAILVQAGRGGPIIAAARV
ncbi:DUF1223 domain-containing protein [Lichenicola cladoniae]|uniref:DUF1223 domain-containing protein n=2 Tax=Lichenicola cladoniae TaxID=1484109 RepID=A0A6M8HXE8_9PROT|nr:DUF1223 domain-containing protein [Acetobacteraceae bacterium]QKE92771.1 DUF1223 domain-containing protein [Lichenicola cladoniae]